MNELARWRMISDQKWGIINKIFSCEHMKESSGLKLSKWSFHFKALGADNGGEKILMVAYFRLICIHGGTVCSYGNSLQTKCAFKWSQFFPTHFDNNFLFPPSNPSPTLASKSLAYIRHINKSAQPHLHFEESL